MPIKISDEAKVQMPMKTVISLIIIVALGTMGYFQIVERLNIADTRLQLMEKDLEENTEFRIKWPRGEMGSLPADSEQFMLIEHLSEQLAKLQEQIDEGRAPHDQQQKLTLDFYEKRLTNIEAQIEKMRNGQSGN